MWRLKMILFEDRAGLLKINGFSGTVAYQLCWVLRCNRVYSRNISLKARSSAAREGAMVRARCQRADHPAPSSGADGTACHAGDAGPAGQAAADADGSGDV